MGGDAIHILSSSVSSITAPTARLGGKLRRQYNVVSEQASHSLHFLHCPKQTAVIHPSLCFLSPKPTCYTAACLFSSIKKVYSWGRGWQLPACSLRDGAVSPEPWKPPPLPRAVQRQLAQ